MAAVREIMLARRGQKAKEHPLELAFGHTSSPTVVVYNAGESAANEPASRGGKVSTMGGRPRAQAVGRTPSTSAPLDRQERVERQEATTTRKQPVNPTSNGARSKIGEAPPVPTANRGKVPSYLKQRKQELAADKAAAEYERTKEKVPEGLRRIGPAEQQETLEILNERKANAEKKYQHLPLRITTQRAKQGKEALEEKIRATEALIKLYSKQKVYVPLHVEPMSRQDEDEDDIPSPQAPAFDRPAGGMPWSHGSDNVKTFTKVLEPPGGKSSIQFG
jgi:hypothetical protein